MTVSTLPGPDPVPASETRPDSWPATDTSNAPLVDVVVPVHNEEVDLEPCVRRLHAYLANGFPYRYVITIADNASTDATLEIAERLARELPQVRTVHIPAKGRGLALRHSWSHSKATVLAYTDVDLSTDLAALLPLVAPLISGHSDLAIGSRLAPGARVVRGPKRELISRCYNLLVRGALATRFSDAQCGFKAIRRDVASQLLPLVEDTGWFFDTELLVLAERAGLRIHEVPVDWVDDPDSRVDIVTTAIGDLKGIARLVRAFASGRLPLRQVRRPSPVPDVPAGMAGQLVRFAAVGTASTLAYLVLYAVLRTVAEPQLANLVALLVTAIGNTGANRRLTFGVRGHVRIWRHQLQGLALFCLGLGLTAGSLAGLAAISPGPHRILELAVLVAANLTATVLRFVLFRWWVFPPSGAAGR